MAIWLVGGEDERTLLISVPSGGGELPRLDIFDTSIRYRCGPLGV